MFLKCRESLENHSAVELFLFVRRTLQFLKENPRSDLTDSFDCEIKK
jgi:hypothetical protein